MTTKTEAASRLVQCRYCDAEPFNDFKELAIHILTNKKGHRGGLIWARKYMSRQGILDRKLSLRGRDRAPITEKDRENRDNSRRELSGKQSAVTTICLKGKHAVLQYLPREYAESPYAWRVQGRLVVACEAHR